MAKEHSLDAAKNGTAAYFPLFSARHLCQ